MATSGPRNQSLGVNVKRMARVHTIGGVTPGGVADDDGWLGRRLRVLLGARHPTAAAAAVTSGRVRVAARGATGDQAFEIGSVSKAVTGLLYAEALERGILRGSVRLGDLLDLGDTPVSGVTLEALATHRSGLPRLPTGSDKVRRTWDLWRFGRNPYGESLDTLLAQARATPLRRPRPRYSNLGFELLGHAVAAAHETTYVELLRARVTEPLGLGATYAPSTPSALRPDAVTGRSRSGRPREPWTGEALAPAGGIRSSVADMARLVAALLDGSAPGLSALDPVASFAGPVRIGAAWIALNRNGRTVTWHNGQTGGFASWIGLDRRAGTGAVILTGTSATVDRQGFALLRELSQQS